MDLIAEAYSEADNLKDGYSFVGWLFNQNGKQKDACKYLEKDYREKRQSTTWKLNYVQILAEQEDHHKKALELLAEAYTDDINLKDDPNHREWICQLLSDMFPMDEHLTLFHNCLLTYMEFHHEWEGVRRFVQTDDIEIARRYQSSQLKSLAGNHDVENLILDIICQGNEVFLSNGVMEFPDRRSLWVLIHEILINEDYFFETNTDSPYILDCGTHCGLAIYYFKNLYPKAKIIGFEPVPTLYKMALENMSRNNYSNVNILPYALSDTDRSETFIISDTDSMAGSLAKIRQNCWLPAYF